MAPKNEKEMELFVRQVTKRGGGQASREDQDQHAEIGRTVKVSITINEEAIKTTPREERLRKFKDGVAEARKNPNTESTKPKIQRVPFVLRDQTDKYYEPRAAAIGPFHHGKKQKYEQAEKVKRRLAAQFIIDSEQNDETALLNKVDEKIKELRECYDEEATKDYDDESLAWMLFVDGCSMLEFIYKYETLESFKIKRDQVAFAEQDMFLLENQLPYQLLTLLMSSSSKYDDLKKKINIFVQMHAHEKPKSQPTPKPEQNPRPGAGVAQPGQHCAGTNTNREEKRHPEGVKITIGPERERKPDPEPTHLLELLRRTMLGVQLNNTCETSKTSETSETGKTSETSNTGETGKTSVKLTHLLELLRTKLRFPPNKTRELPQSFRNVQELQAAGIHFRRTKGPSSLGDIKFKSFLCYGFLYLLEIKVDDSTGPKFMNLIAYEMCADFQNDFGVTSYIAFLDSLMDHPDDVKHLRKKHILRNLLGSDEEVARLFNEIGTDLVPNNKIYSKVKRDIEAHYQTTWKKWMAQFLHDHFSSPWTFLAFIGVLFGLGMTGVQTWYTVNSGTPPCEALLEYLKARGY